MSKSEICRRLREARETAYPDKTPAEVSRITHISPANISRSERGAVPRADQIPTYATAYNTDCNWIITGVGKKPRRVRT